MQATAEYARAVRQAIPDAPQRAMVEEKHQSNSASRKRKMKPNKLREPGRTRKPRSRCGLFRQRYPASQSEPGKKRKPLAECEPVQGMYPLAECEPSWRRSPAARREPIREGIADASHVEGDTQRQQAGHCSKGDRGPGAHRNRGAIQTHRVSH